MRGYAEFAFAGDATAGDRLALLEAHRDAVRVELAELQQNLAFIEYKVDMYKKRAT